MKEHSSYVTSALYKHRISNNHPQAYISCYLEVVKQVAREARKAIHIRISNPAFNCNTRKMYIPEIFNHLLGADRSSNESSQVADSDLPLRSHSLHLSRQQVCKSSVFGKLGSLSITTDSTDWNPSLSPIAKCQNLLLQSSNSSKAPKRCFEPPGSVYTDLSTPVIGVKDPSDTTAHTSR